jgi:NADP-dependent 3-hydroxy acid dehydrogenase YdfG
MQRRKMNTKIRPAIAGKVAIITGASSGIGEAAAREFARAGAKTILAARRMERLERLAQEITGAGGIALPVRTDLTDPRQIANLVETTLAKFERIDILANIAGWAHYDWFEELSTEDLRHAYDVNIIGMGELIRQVLPTMKAQRSGIILNMCSYASRIAVPPLTLYASTKYAVEGLSDGLRRELQPWGIKVIRIHPASVSGTEFKQVAEMNGGVPYPSSPLGRISREYVARELVQLAEKPKRDAFLGRLYDLPVAINAVFPAFFDWVSSTWVRSSRRKELANRSHD